VGAAELRDRELERRWRSSRRRDAAWQVVLPIAVLLPVAVAWQLGGMRPGNILLPTFTAFLGAVVKLALGRDFWEALVTSESALLIGFGAAVATGVPLGLGMGRLRWMEAVVDPYLNIALVTPMAIVMPLILMIFGLTTTSRAIVVFVFAFVFIVVPCRAGVLTISGRLEEMCRSFGAGEWQIWRELLIPGAMPAIVTGLRQGFAHALTGMLVAELTLLAVGIGRLLLTYQGTFEEASVFAVVFLIICQSILAMTILQAIERRVGGAGRLAAGDGGA
jgi:NitT/TauT family transport system permease protein